MFCNYAFEVNSYLIETAKKIEICRKRAIGKENQSSVLIIVYIKKCFTLLKKLAVA